MVLGPARIIDRRLIGRVATSYRYQVGQKTERQRGDRCPPPIVTIIWPLKSLGAEMTWIRGRTKRWLLTNHHESRGD
jgi:hypothetical protein